MTAFFTGMIVLRLLSAAILLLGLYKIISFAHAGLNREKPRSQSRGFIILKERLASGEIDEDTYQSMRKVLGD